ncbi:hypothetical protein [Phycicoccus sp.]|uniref:hypothetical protein n=1 Tax=Phycicoccus sp. TaxID=1902410 RepID=UPI002D023709|nr:hypothetical protein [Phycicoccus sp.]HMM95295.1 hypothetical protein [Phycicoccus sp.]
MTIHRFTYAAPIGSVFAPGAFDSQRGKTVPLTLPDGSGGKREIGTATVLDIDDETGDTVTLTIDVASDEADDVVSAACVWWPAPGRGPR